MYNVPMVKVMKADNGYIVECCVPYKPKGKKGKGVGTAEPVGYNGEGEKSFVASTEAEVATLISKLLPLLDAEYTDSKEFENAFGEAARG